MTSVGEYNCIFCKATFDDKETLQIHFRKHGDPNFNQKRRYSTPKMSGDKANEPDDMVSCDVCPEVFPTISKAITHKHKVHPDHDAKYFCPWCGKLFTMKHLYNKHMQANHTEIERNEGKTFHCDCCDVDFFVAPAMLCHNKFFHRQDTDLPSVGLSKKQKLYNQEAIPIYYCPFCGEEYDNKVNLHKHMGDDHGDENQSPDEILRCPLCEALFYHLDAYEIHLTFHSTEDYYCDQNEMRGEITEYSLETVAPITEKVENLEQQSKDEEAAMNAMGIDQFLQLAMDDSSDNGPKKSKKHKKHKKSKKSAITLDEFLNMNKDMFGEELDVHGVEEVPTRVVARRLKVNKKPPQKNKTAAKFATSDLQKLKQQGIVVKKKPVVNTSTSQSDIGIRPIQPLKLSENLIARKETQNKINTNSTSNEVLSKLLKQSNNQIKIVKKSVPASNSVEDQVNDNHRGVENDGMIDEDSGKEEFVNEKLEDKSPDFEPEHNTDTEETEDERLKNNQNTSQIVSKTQDSEITSKIDSLDELEARDMASSHYEDLQINNEETGQISSSVTDQKNISEEHSKEDIQRFGDLDSKDDSDQQTCNIVAEESNNVLTKIDENYQSKYNNTSNIQENNTNKSLSALKHLSHLITVKPVGNIKNTLADKGNETVFSTDTNSGASNQCDVVPPVFQNSDMSEMNKNHPINVPQKSIDVLKNLNKNITVKSLTQPSNTCNYNEDESSENYVNPETTTKPVIKGVTDTNTSLTSDNSQSNLVQSVMSKNIKENLQHAHHSPTSIKKTIVENPNKELLHDSAKEQANASILKRLTNVTAKPLNTAKDINKEVIENQTNRNVAAPKINTKRFVSKEIDEDIEIFNIDDSDSDNDNEMEKLQGNIDSKVSEPIKPTIQPSDALKCLGKHITIKNMRQETTNSHMVKKEPAHESCERQTETFSERKQFVTKTMKSQTDSQSVNPKNSILNNVLKNLGKNITVKSRNHSPCQSVTSQDNNTQDSNIENSDDSDTESYKGKVTITEIENDDDLSENEIDSKQYNQNKDDAQNQNVRVQSPDDSCSDREGSLNEDNMLEEERDFEEQIKVSKLTNAKDSFPASKSSSSLNSLKGISKDITIKSLNENTFQSGIEKTSDKINNPNKNSTVKPLKQGRLEQGNVSMISNRRENYNNAKHQTNTVNKAVTVKTFQTQTVIQEITTTVTKTIRTVNQVQNQSCFKAITPPQRFQGIRPNIPVGRNLQGVTVRQRSPNIGCKIRNANPSVRPVVRNPVNPSNQLVAVRPGINMPRQVTPRMPSIQKQPTTPNQQRARNLKISPNAITSSVNKRPSSEETSGPFSCFKKPKETLFPVSDFPKVNNDCNMSNIHFSSSSESSKSNVSTTNVARGNSVVTSTHMKSEVRATQQLSKLSNVSGLKIVKTNKQQELQEKSETSSKLTTLNVIEKLQKQGLLVKKPRLDVNEVSNLSEPEDDYNEEYSSAEENDN